jgi:hypothetical protein
MAVNTTQILDVYTVLFNDITTKLDTLYTDKKIDATTYSSLMSSVIGQLVPQVGDIVQKQETIDNDLAIRTAQLDDSILTSVEQRKGMVQDNLVKVQQVAESLYRVTNVLPAELKELEKRTEVAERGMIEQELTGIKQRLILDEEKETSDLNQILLATEETIKEAQLLDVIKGTDIKERQVVLQEDESAKQLLILDEQKVKLQEEIKQAYVDRVIKDKQATKLGLDNVTLNVNTNPENVYTPKYEEA